MLGKVQLAKLQPQHVQRLLDDKSKQGLSPRQLPISERCFVAPSHKRRSGD
jgi:hypothetical protein